MTTSFEREQGFAGQAGQANCIDVDAQLEGCRMRLSLAGELDLATVPGLEEAIDALPWQEFEELVIDLAQITFIDSSGLELLIRTSRRAASGSRRFSITRVPAQPCKLFQITGVVDTLGIESSECSSFSDPAASEAARGSRGQPQPPGPRPAARVPLPHESHPYSARARR